MLVPILLLGVVGSTLSSPFKLTEQYIEEFKNGIESLKKVAHEYKFPEKDFDFGLQNITIPGTPQILL